jgi:hypothetical protein
VRLFRITSQSPVILLRIVPGGHLILDLELEPDLELDLDLDLDLEPDLDLDPDPDLAVILPRVTSHNPVILFRVVPGGHFLTGIV